LQKFQNTGEYQHKKSDCPGSVRNQKNPKAPENFIKYPPGRVVDPLRTRAFVKFAVKADWHDKKQ